MKSISPLVGQLMKRKLSLGTGGGFEGSRLEMQPKFKLSGFKPRIPTGLSAINSNPIKNKIKY